MRCKEHAMGDAASNGREGCRQGESADGRAGLLIVDDDVGLLNLMARMLGNEYRCRTAENPARAREILAGESFDLVLSDIQMPGESGLSLIKFIRTAHPETGVVVVSVIEDPNEARQAMEAGIEGYLVKPFDQHQLMITVANALKVRQFLRLQRSYRADLEAAVLARTSELRRSEARRKENEQALAKAHNEMAAMIAGISAILIGLSPDRRVTHWNDTAARIFGRAAADVLGREFTDCGFSWAGPEVINAVSFCLEARATRVLDDVPFTRQDGKNGLLGLRMNPVDGDARTATGLLIMGADITERRHMEAQLAQAQKLESIGQLAAGIAHEINTPTQYVGDNVRFLRDAFSDLIPVLEICRRLADAGDGGMREAVQEADLEYLMAEIPLSIDQTLEGIARIAKIVRSMKAFSHPGTDEMTSMDINAAIENTVTVTRNEWKYVAELVTHLSPDLPRVHCLVSEMNQVFLNLIVNAAHAIAENVGKGGEKGRIEIATGVSGDHVEIRIADTGAGIPETIRHRVFDPFFTTKDVGKGTGQGLALAHATVVDKHGGRLFFETAQGRGTVFHILLPAKAGAEKP